MAKSKSRRRQRFWLCSTCKSWSRCPRICLAWLKQLNNQSHLLFSIPSTEELQKQQEKMAGVSCKYGLNLFNFEKMPNATTKHHEWPNNRPASHSGDQLQQKTKKKNENHFQIATLIIHTKKRQAQESHNMSPPAIVHRAPPPVACFLCVTQKLNCVHFLKISNITWTEKKPTTYFAFFPFQFMNNLANNRFEIELCGQVCS